MDEEQSCGFGVSNGVVIGFFIIVACFAAFFLVDIGAKTFREHTHTITIEDKQHIHIESNGGSYYGYDGRRHRRYSSREIDSYYIYGIREDGEHVSYELNSKFMFLNTAPESYYNLIDIGKTYQVTVTGLCFRKEILLNHIVEINNKNDFVEQRQKTGFEWKPFLIYTAIIWFVFGLVAGIIKGSKAEDKQRRSEMQIAMIIACIATILLSIVAITMW